MRLSEIAWEKGDCAVVAVGNFDGLHPGHAAILSRLIQESKAQNALSVVITFSPHPVEYFRGIAMDRLTTLPDRVAGIRSSGVDRVFVLDFDEALANTSAEAFVAELIAKFSMRALILGPNGALGKGKEGTPVVLEKILRDRGVDLIVTAPEKIEGHWISSSRIRESLREGDVEGVVRLLGRPYEIVGRIAPGHAIARGMGTPTLNLSNIETLLPMDGVYATRTFVQGAWRGSVTNIGIRPTFHDTSERVVETHVLDQSLQGEILEARVRFLFRLRDEKKFKDAKALALAIAQDIEQARRYLGQHPSRD